MKSIKPGRGPSKRSFAGSVFVVIFGIMLMSYRDKKVGVSMMFKGVKNITQMKFDILVPERIELS